MLSCGIKSKVQVGDITNAWKKTRKSETFKPMSEEARDEQKNLWLPPRTSQGTNGTH